MLDAEFKSRHFRKRGGGVDILTLVVIVAACRRLPRLKGEIMHILRPAPFVNEAVLRVLYVGVFGGDLHPAPVVVGDIGKAIGLHFAVQIVLFVEAFYILAVKEDEGALAPFYRPLLLICGVLARHVLGEQDGFLRDTVEDEHIGVCIEGGILFAQRAHGAQHGIIYCKGDDRDDDEGGIRRHPHVYIHRRNVSRRGVSLEHIRHSRAAARRDGFHHRKEGFAESGIGDVVVIGKAHAEADDKRRQHHEYHESRPAHAGIAGDVGEHGAHIYSGKSQGERHAQPHGDADFRTRSFKNQGGVA